MKYIALLRGINVGGNKKVPMADLKKAFEELGFTDVKTLLNSGNVLFITDKTEVAVLKAAISEKLEKTFGWVIGIFVVPQTEIKKLVENNPFKHKEMNPEMRLYVTFYDGVHKSRLKIPYESSAKDFGIVQVSNGAICSYLILSHTRGTVDFMSFIEKEFGKNVTTRNWNTVIKLYRPSSADIRG